MGVWGKTFLTDCVFPQLKRVYSGVDLFVRVSLEVYGLGPAGGYTGAASRAYPVVHLREPPYHVALPVLYRILFYCRIWAGNDAVPACVAGHRVDERGNGLPGHLVRGKESGRQAR